MDGFVPPDAILFLSGMAGAIVFSFLRPDRSSWIKPVGNLTVGTLAAYFTAPAFCEWREWQTVSQRNACGFVFGLLGMVICRMLVASAESDAAAGIFKMVKRAFGFKEDEPPKP